MLFSAAKVALVLCLASTYKTLPLAYFIRFYAIIVKNLVFTRRNYRQTRANTFGISGAGNLDVFRSTSYHTYASPLEIDMYLHKSNSTYLVDLDIARAEYLTTVFQKIFMSSYENETGEFKRKSHLNYPYIPVGTIKCVFKKEIKAFQRYTIKSNLLAWDDKWLYILLKFELPGNKLCAVAVTKYVFKKNGRMTIKPRELLETCGFYNEEAGKINAEKYKLISYLQSSEGLEEVAGRL